MPWTVVIPVRAPGKTRLGRGPEFARAIARDTIEAAIASGAQVIVVTADDELAARTTARVVREPEPAGIAAAIALGLRDVPLASHRAAMLGDLPALDPAELAGALDAAAAFGAAFVPDADGIGTTLVTARAGSPLLHSFGPGSARSHRELGLQELELDPTSTLRRDVDLEEHLLDLRPRLGPHTASLLARG